MKNDETKKEEQASDEKIKLAKEEPVEELDPLEKLKEQNEKLRNEYLYLRAEFDNFRKNSIKERSDLIKYGPERMVTSLLDVIDIFDKALDSEVNTDNIDSFVEGVKMTSVELTNTLEKFGVKPVESLHQAFDPNIHEAMGSEESSEVEPGYITQVFKKPFKFHDKVIRHGQVIIAKAPTQKETTEEEDEIIGFE